MDEIERYLTSIPAWYLATIDEADPTQPRVRPFSFAMVDDGKLWFCTSRDKDVWRELEAHPKFELSGWKPGAYWIVVTGEADLADDANVSDRVREEGFRHMLGIGEHRRRGMAAVLQTVGHPLGQLGRLGISAFDAIDAGLDFGDEPYPCAWLLAASAQECVDVCRVVAADLVAGEHYQIRFGLTDRGRDETDGVPVDLGLVLDVGHLQHTKCAVLVESQRHGSTVAA